MKQTDFLMQTLCQIENLKKKQKKRLVFFSFMFFLGLSLCLLNVFDFIDLKASFVGFIVCCNSGFIFGFIYNLLEFDKFEIYPIVVDLLIKQYGYSQSSLGEEYVLKNKRHFYVSLKEGAERIIQLKEVAPPANRVFIDLNKN